MVDHAVDRGLVGGWLDWLAAPDAEGICHAGVSYRQQVWQTPSLLGKVHRGPFRNLRGKIQRSIAARRDSAFALRAWHASRGPKRGIPYQKGLRRGTIGRRGAPGLATCPARGELEHAGHHEGRLSVSRRHAPKRWRGPATRATQGHQQPAWRSSSRAPTCSAPELCSRSRVCSRISRRGVRRTRYLRGCPPPWSHNREGISARGGDGRA